MTETVNFQLPGYTIEALIGRGGMARVYRATQQGLDRPVAIKLMLGDATEHALAVERFEREARLIAELEHPHIVGIHAIGRTELGHVYYVMPLLAGGDLAAKAKPMAESDVRALLEKLLDALTYAHSRGVVHRDLKAANILFDAHGRPQIADFGVALRPRAARLTGEGQTVGSSLTMSPEQARGLPLDARSDLYSLGVVAFELLTGHLPYTGEDAFAVALAHVHDPIPPLPIALAHWQAFINRALAKEPNDRYADAAAMAAALPLLHRRRSDTAPMPVVKPRQPMWPWALGLSAAVLTTVLVYQPWAGPAARIDPYAPIEAQLDAGLLHPPAQPNALSSLMALDPAQSDPTRIEELRARLLGALAPALHEAAGSADFDALALLVVPWVEAVAITPNTTPLQIEVELALEAALELAFTEALGQGDRGPAEAALALLPLLPTLSPDLHQLAQQVRALYSLGEALDFDDGLGYTVVRLPTASEPGWALSRAVPASAVLAIRELLRDAPPKCVAATPLPPPAASCIANVEAQRLAKDRSPARIPTIVEWQQLLASVAQHGPGRWLTADCHYEQVVIDKPNALERSAGRVSRLFGGQGAQVKRESRCVGLKVIDAGGNVGVQRQDEAHADVGLRLLRELPLRLPGPS